MHNQEISKILFELAELYEMKNVPFKPRALLRASETIHSGKMSQIFIKKAKLRRLKIFPELAEELRRKSKNT